MKKYLLFLLAAILPALRIGAQQPPGVACQEWQVVAGDTIPHVRIRPVWVFARGADLRRYRKLVAAVKKVYPVAKRRKKPTSGASIAKSRRSTRPSSNT